MSAYLLFFGAKFVMSLRPLLHLYVFSKVVEFQVVFFLQAS